MFSKRAVIDVFDGKPALILRIANQRADEIIEASASLTWIKDDVAGSGAKFRRLVDLPLMRPATPVFTMSWTVIHLIDDYSPLHGQTELSLKETLSEFLILFTGHHEGFGQKVHARGAYTSWDLVWNSGFVDMFVNLPDGRRALDLGCFDHIVEH
jgi:inward rectifier potassium channel